MKGHTSPNTTAPTRTLPRFEDREKGYLVVTTIIIVGVIAALAGYVIGRVQSTGRHHERAFQPWRDHVMGCALSPRPLTIEGECTDLTNARPVSSFKFMQPRRGAPAAS
jgi:hypothetical protein